jgi:hypothetical protein
MLLPRYERPEALQIVDERGTRLGSVTRPTDPRLFGPDKGTVFLNRSAPSPEPRRGPAQAA